MADASDVVNEKDLFRVQHKYYKSRKPPPDLSQVVDIPEFDQASQFHLDVPCDPYLASSCWKLGLKPVDKWQCFELKGSPGFLYIRNPFRPGYQRYWIKRCLQDYPNKPNVCNLDRHPAGRETDLTLWDDSLTTDSPSQSKKRPLDQLRWVTMGYHYDWAAMVYHKHNFTPFPGDLTMFSACVAAMVGCPTFRAEAGFVSVYHFDSTLGGHNDHSEFDMTAPIITFSLGQSAVFLLGGKTKETSPLAMYLHSGDFIVLGGQSRLLYHSVPKILTPAHSDWLPPCLDAVDASLIRTDRDESTDSQVQACNSAPKTSSNGSNNTGEAKESISLASAQSDSALDTTTKLVGGGNLGGKSDRHEHDSVCPLKLTADRISTDFSLIEETALALQNHQTWEHFAKFMTRTRLSVSVRQVTGDDREFPGNSTVGD